MKNTVLVGEPDQSRFTVLKGIIEEEFVVSVEQANTFDAIYSRLQSGNTDVMAVMLADTLPLSARMPNVMLSAYLIELRSLMFLGRRVCLFREDIPPEFVGEGAAEFYFVQFTEGPLTQENRNKLKNELEPLLRAQPRLPLIQLADDPQLREQIKELTENSSISDGIRILAQLIRRFLSCRTCRIEKLTPGLSGAAVFRILPTSAHGVSEYALKLSRDRWKIREEARRHELVPHGVDGYRKHIPKLLLPECKDSGIPQAVAYGEWVALCYDFLGGDATGPLMDLQTALVAAPPQIISATQNAEFRPKSENLDDIENFRLEALSSLLDWLFFNWYSKSGLISRRSVTPWHFADGLDRQYPIFPPYVLPAKVKARIKQFLEGRDASLGRRLLKEWDGVRDRIWRFLDLEMGPSGLNWLDEPIAMVMSPAHGDLNSTNAFLWLDHKDHPFLLDFPMFQISGHALQDLARLEIEIKFMLMDRQEYSDVTHLPALDLTWSQLKVWTILEDHLLSDTWKDPLVFRSSDGFGGNAVRSLEMIRIIRARACDVQKQVIIETLPPPFMQEYRPALLYHTLRSISYETIPVFKRLLATYSASRMLL